MFDEWLDALVDEKGWDTEMVFEVEGPSGLNLIPLAVMIEAMKSAPPHDQTAIKDVVVKLDFVNADILNYLRHLAQAIAV